jgi:hypothetical protein
MSPHGNICCDPRYKVVRTPKTLPSPPSAPPRAILTLATPTQAGRFTIKGPSATGPWTYRDASGAAPLFRSGGIGTGQSLGLT